MTDTNQTAGKSRNSDDLRMMAKVFQMDPRNRASILSAADEIDRLTEALSFIAECGEWDKFRTYGVKEIENFARKALAMTEGR